MLGGVDHPALKRGARGPKRRGKARYIERRREKSRTGRVVFRKPEARVPAGLAFLPGWRFFRVGISGGLAFLPGGCFCRVEIKGKGRGWLFGFLDLFADVGKVFGGDAEIGGEQFGGKAEDLLYVLGILFGEFAFSIVAQK